VITCVCLFARAPFCRGGEGIVITCVCVCVCVCLSVYHERLDVDQTW